MVVMAVVWFVVAVGVVVLVGRWIRCRRRPSATRSDVPRLTSDDCADDDKRLAA